MRINLGNFEHALKGFSRLMRRRASHWIDKDDLQGTAAARRYETISVANVYYFYSGRGKPIEIDVSGQLFIKSDAYGDITKDFFIAHNKYVHLSDKDYNEKMYMKYNVLRNPPLYILQTINRFYGLDDMQHLEEFAGMAI